MSIDISAVHERVSASTARLHLIDLLYVPGATTRLVAAITGVSHSLICQIMTGKQKITALTESKILGVSEKQLTADLRIIRTARCLVAQGWGVARQAELMGQPTEWVRLLLEGEIYIMESQAEAVQDLAAAIDAAPARGGSVWGPDLEEAIKAHERGWWPLMCYDAWGELCKKWIRVKGDGTEYPALIRQARERWHEIPPIDIRPRRMLRALSKEYVRVTALGIRDRLPAPAIARLMRIPVERVLYIWKEMGMQWNEHLHAERVDWARSFISRAETTDPIDLLRKMSITPRQGILR